MSFPEEFLLRLRNIYPNEYEKVLEVLSSPKPLSVRVNTLKADPVWIENTIIRQGAETGRVSWTNESFMVKNIDKSTLTDLYEYKEGMFYLQNLSSVKASLVLNPQEQETILDIAAAPGSKTSHIAALMKNTGKIVANDISRDRIFKLKANMDNLGVTNVEYSNMPGEKIWQKYPQFFDRVLVDAPCSMEGRFYLYEPSTYQDWSVKKVKQLAKEQKWLLRSAVSAAKVGGVIVYSTCTLAPEENEEIIEWILKKEKKSLELEKMERITPSSIMEGFFIAKLRKISSNVRQ